MHAATSTPLADRVRLMAHPSVIRAFTAPNSVRLFQNNPPHGLLRRTCISGRQSFRHVAACMLVRAAGPSLPVLAPPTGPPVYGRACPNRGLPRPGSAMATRPNHPLPRQDLHLQACQRPKAALRRARSVENQSRRRLKLRQRPGQAGHTHIHCQATNTEFDPQVPQPQQVMRST